MTYLLGISEAVKDRTFNINKNRTSIGRVAANDIVLDDAAVSSSHCYIAQRGDRFVIHDLNSTNGTLLDGKRINEADMSNGQIVTIGALEFKLVVDEDTPAAAPEGAAQHTQILSQPAMTVAIPGGFSSVSPFGARHTERRGLWLALLIGGGVLAVAALVYLIWEALKV